MKASKCSLVLSQRVQLNGDISPSLESLLLLHLRPRTSMHPAVSAYCQILIVVVEARWSQMGVFTNDVTCTKPHRKTSTAELIVR